jgi:threonine/homoserine/homoserine lactone efflux protein
MNWETWLLFLVTEIVLSMSPGPAVLLVISQSLRGGGWQGIWAAIGILTANVIWFTLSAIGVGTAILAAGPWFTSLKWIGAAYLVYLAGLALLGNHRAEGDSLRVAPETRSARSIWMHGLVLQLTNPKALMFFVALLPQFIDPQRPAEPQVLILGITSLAAEFPILALYAALAGRASMVARDRRLGRAIDFATAALLLIAALGVLTTA